MRGKAKMEIGQWKRNSGILATLQMIITKLWQGLREWSGDAAYERYAACAARAHEGRVLTREEFYVQQLQRKYSRVSRCC